MKNIIMSICCLALIPCHAYAGDTCHTPPPRHTCVKPVHPRASTLSAPEAGKAAQPPDYDFMNEVDTYKNCILAFLATQNQAIKVHTTARDDAADEWYAFIKESIASGVLHER